MTRLVAVLVLLGCLVSLNSAAHIAYITDYIPSNLLITDLTSSGHFVDTFTSSILNSGISVTYEITLFQNEGGVGWNPTWRSTIENYANSGGVFLYFGRDCLVTRQRDMLETLGFSDVYDRSSGLTSPNSIFSSPIQTEQECYPLVNSWYYDLRSQIPSSAYFKWMSGHLLDINTARPGKLDEGEGSYNMATTCLADSSFGYPYCVWAIRTVDYSINNGRGKIVYMSTSTAIVEEFYKSGFYRRALYNLISYSATGIIFGDPYVVSLNGQKFSLQPDEISGNFLNLYHSEALEISAKVEAHPSGGVWVTEVGAHFVVDGVTHELHGLVDLDENLRFFLDGHMLIDVQSNDNWEFKLENDVIVGSWHNRFQFESPALFKLLKADDGSMFLIQAVVWNYIPSFSVEVHSGSNSLTRSFDPIEGYGLLQHPLRLSAVERDETEDPFLAPDVFVYTQDRLFV